MPLQVLLILPPCRGAEGCFWAARFSPPSPPPLPAAPSPRHDGSAAAALCSDISLHRVGKATGAQGFGEPAAAPAQGSREALQPPAMPQTLPRSTPAPFQNDPRPFPARGCPMLLGPRWQPVTPRSSHGKLSAAPSGTCTRVTARVWPQLEQFPPQPFGLRVCPHCLSADTIPMGHVLGTAAATKRRRYQTRESHAVLAILWKTPPKSVKIPKKLIPPPFFSPFLFSSKYFPSLMLSLACGKPSLAACTGVSLRSGQAAGTAGGHTFCCSSPTFPGSETNEFWSAHARTPPQQPSSCPQALPGLPAGKQTPELQPTAVP